MIYKPKRPNPGAHGLHTGAQGAQTGLGATGTGTGTLTGCGTLKFCIKNYKTKIFLYFYLSQIFTRNLNRYWLWTRYLFKIK
jgi:hypothetical protein